MGPPPRIELRSLSFRYPDGTRALEHVDLAVAEGEALGIVGANGSGKSTLLLHLTGCLLATGGEVRVDGLAVEPATVKAIRRKVGMMFQDPDDQLFMPTVAEDVTFGLRAALGMTEPLVQERARQALAAVGAAHLASRATARLSVGEKRLAALAAVLALEPEVLVLDEPTAGLDPRARRECATLLARLSCTRILATHDLDLVWDLCDRVAVLDHGRLVALGVPETILTDAALLERAQLELPLRLQGCPRCRLDERAEPTPASIESAQKNGPPSG